MPSPIMLAFVGRELFELMEAILTMERDALHGNPLYEKVCEINASGMPIAMRFEDATHGMPDAWLAHVDWRALSGRMDIRHFRVDEQRMHLVFENVHDLFRGLDELYGCLPVNQSESLVARCLRRIQASLDREELMEGMGAMSL